MTTTASTPTTALDALRRTATDGPTGAHIDEFSGYTGAPNPLGGLWAIYGKHFGVLPQPVTINGKEIKVTSWRDDRIKGTLPYDFETGPAVVEVCGARWECSLST